MTEQLTHARFAASVAYLAKVAAQWAGDSLMLPEHHDKPVSRSTVDRFCAEIRDRVSYIEQMSLAAAAEEHRANVLPKLHAICEQHERGDVDVQQAFAGLLNVLGRGPS